MVKGKPIKEMKPTLIRLPLQTYDELDKIAEQTGICRTDLMKLSIVEFLNKANKRGM